MVDLVTFGETMLRFSPPDDERIETADRYGVRAAGAESNVAVTAQRLGLDAAWTSKLPDSPVARRVTGELRSHGVTVDVAWSDDGRQGTFYLETGEQPRGNTVIYDRTDAAVTTATPPELPVAGIEDAAGFHTTGITPALSDTLSETTATLLETAREAGTTTSFDCNYRSKLWSPAEARETLTGLLDDVDVFTVAERDAREVFEKSGEPADIGREFAETYDLDVAILTRGTDPALAVTGDAVYEQPTFESTDAHPVGTGDSFVGGFLSQYLDGQSVPDALEYAAATAAFKRTVPGDIAVVSPEEVESVIGGDTADISR
ncbi:bifunctional 2-dehydro-3-deoxygluconokinase/2-dehydro-3-deoxygalactonokinase [Haloarcula laminariae]|uniref:bifunctional 2-dehydro-3-deoxygluconokinase/2-dehydro-3- deoxygalactonokinase n=1 Tax=Haloarcula laminariae TaxID=2961577 RepID=UPI0021C713AF|nr:bifunctional 2-dehydro-3-deoxygluconokinase/2-dehydro-3-deoxygalactonokinase [Halomicroarcula laminariae]